MQRVVDLIRNTVRGDEAAWQEFVVEVAPTVEAMARTHRSLRAKGHTHDDDLAEVLTATLGRMQKDQFRNLRQFLDQYDRLGPELAQSFDGWLFGALDYSVREYLRQRYGRAPKVAPEGPPSLSRRDLGTHAARIPTGADLVAPPECLPGVTTRLMLGQILRAVEGEFTTDEMRALRLYYGEDQSYAEIAQSMGLESPGTAEKLIRRLNARLRYRFDDGI